MTTTLDILAPLSGPVLSLEEVPDPVFSKKLVGDGLAIDPITSVLLAPCTGEVTQMHPSRHALTIQSDDGGQILMHVGLETVTLKGEGFEALVKVGDRVQAGQPLLSFDPDLIARKAKSLITVIVMTDSTQSVLQKTRATSVAVGDKIFSIPFQAASSEPAKTIPTQKVTSRPLTVHLKSGLHARPSALLAAHAKTFDAEIQIHKVGSEKAANAKSLVSLLALEIGCGDTIQFSATGNATTQAIASLQDFILRLEDENELGSHDQIHSQKASTAPSLDGKIRGVSASPGIRVGFVRHIKSFGFNVPERSETSPSQERLFLEDALKKSTHELRILTEKSAIFAAHQELLEDPALLEETIRLIQQGKSAAFAWQTATELHAQSLSHLKNELMAQRAADLRDIGGRVLRKLLPESQSTSTALKDDHSKPIILVAENLAPSDTVSFERDGVVGFCTTTGGPTSHVAILARSLGVPALVGAEAALLQIADGLEVILDADQGVLHLHPSEQEKQQALETGRRQRREVENATLHAQSKASTQDGKRIEVAANIGGLKEAIEAVRLGADGVGLLRSEFLFLEREEAPSEEEQFQTYQQISDILHERTFVVRTLDVGGDKPLKYLPLPPEENPFLGIRGIRVGFAHPEVLRTQIRALLRVQRKTPLHIMFPMIATLSDWRRAREMVLAECERLKRPLPSLGIMIEIPSAALIAESLAKEVDFFSIGTNDLTQYTLAMDRGHQQLAAEVDPLHPSVLRLIEMTVKAAHRHGKWVGVCGGLASDLKAVPLLISLGVDELSVSLPSLPLVKAEVRKSRAEQARRLVDEELPL